MLETVAGRYAAREIVYEQEELYDVGYTSTDDMDGLSDSQSTRPSHSRPTTPSSPSTRPIPTHTRTRFRTTSDYTSDQSTSFPRSRSGSDTGSDYFAVPSKATHILGLVPGTLTHAKACLENARDEARRLADITPSATTTSWGDQGIEAKKGSGGRMDRARKALSIAIPNSHSTTTSKRQVGQVPSVVLCLGGEEEESKRERRRRVADGVLHWQKEVARLEHEDRGEMIPAAEVGVGRKGTRKGRK